MSNGACIQDRARNNVFHAFSRLAAGMLSNMMHRTLTDPDVKQSNSILSLYSCVRFVFIVFRTCLRRAENPMSLLCAGMLSHFNDFDWFSHFSEVLVFTDPTDFYPSLQNTSVSKSFLPFRIALHVLSNLLYIVTFLYSGRKIALHRDSNSPCLDMGAM